MSVVSECALFIDCVVLNFKTIITIIEGSAISIQLVNVVNVALLRMVSQILDARDAMLNISRSVPLLIAVDAAVKVLMNDVDVLL